MHVMRDWVHNPAHLVNSHDLFRTRLAWSSGLVASTSASAAAPPAGPASALLRPTIRSELAKTVREGGVTGLYRGMSPTLMGILPYAGLK